MNKIPQTARTALKRLPKRGHFEREQINKILDEGFVCHVGFIVDGQPFHFTKGSSIHTENSHKYGARGSRLLLLSGGWTPLAEWTDPNRDFAVILAIAEPERFAP